MDYGSSADSNSNQFKNESTSAANEVSSPATAASTSCAFSTAGGFTKPNNKAPSIILPSNLVQTEDVIKRVEVLDPERTKSLQNFLTRAARKIEANKAAQLANRNKKHATGAALPSKRILSSAARTALKEALSSIKTVQKESQKLHSTKNLLECDDPAPTDLSPGSHNKPPRPSSAEVKSLLQKKLLAKKLTKHNDEMKVGDGSESLAKSDSARQQITFSLSPQITSTPRTKSKETLQSNPELLINNRNKQVKAKNKPENELFVEDKIRKKLRESLDPSLEAPQASRKGFKGFTDIEILTDGNYFKYFNSLIESRKHYNSRSEILMAQMKSFRESKINKDALTPSTSTKEAKFENLRTESKILSRFAIESNSESMAGRNSGTVEKETNETNIDNELLLRPTTTSSEPSVSYNMLRDATLSPLPKFIESFDKGKHFIPPKEGNKKNLNVSQALKSPIKPILNITAAAAGVGQSKPRENSLNAKIIKKSVVPDQSIVQITRSEREKNEIGTSFSNIKNIGKVHFGFIERDSSKKSLQTVLSSQSIKDTHPPKKTEKVKILSIETIPPSSNFVLSGGGGEKQLLRLPYNIRPEAENVHSKKMNVGDVITLTDSNIHSDVRIISPSSGVPKTETGVGKSVSTNTSSSIKMADALIKTDKNGKTHSQNVQIIVIRENENETRVPNTNYSEDQSVIKESVETSIFHSSTSSGANKMEAIPEKSTEKIVDNEMDAVDFILSCQDTLQDTMDDGFDIMDLDTIPSDDDDYSLEAIMCPENIKIEPDSVSGEFKTSFFSNTNEQNFIRDAEFIFQDSPDFAIKKQVVSQPDIGIEDYSLTEKNIETIDKYFLDEINNETQEDDADYQKNDEMEIDYEISSNAHASIEILSESKSIRSLSDFEANRIVDKPTENTPKVEFALKSTDVQPFSSRKDQQSCKTSENEEFKFKQLKPKNCETDDDCARDIDEITAITAKISDTSLSDHKTRLEAGTVDTSIVDSSIFPDGETKKLPSDNQIPKKVDKKFKKSESAKKNQEFVDATPASLTSETISTIQSSEIEDNFFSNYKSTTSTKIDLETIEKTDSSKPIKRLSRKAVPILKNKSRRSLNTKRLEHELPSKEKSAQKQDNDQLDDVTDGDSTFATNVPKGKEKSKQLKVQQQQSPKQDNKNSFKKSPLHKNQPVKSAISPSSRSLRSQSSRTKTEMEQKGVPGPDLTIEVASIRKQPTTKINKQKRVLESLNLREERLKSFSESGSDFESESCLPQEIAPVDCVLQDSWNISKNIRKTLKLPQKRSLNDSLDDEVNKSLESDKNLTGKTSTISTSQVTPSKRNIRKEKSLNDDTGVFKVPHIKSERRDSEEMSTTSEDMSEAEHILPLNLQQTNDVVPVTASVTEKRKTPVQKVQQGQSADVIASPSDENPLHRRLFLVDRREDLDKNVEEVKTKKLAANEVRCGLCKQISNRKDFEKEHKRLHYGLGWIEGLDDAVDVTSFRNVLYIIQKYCKAFSITTLKCRMCGNVRKSAAGFIRHVENCGLSVEEKKIACEHCKRLLLRHNMDVHLTYCKVYINTLGFVAPPKIAHRNSQDSQGSRGSSGSDAVFSYAGRKKRKSVIQAESKLKDIDSFRVEDHLHNYSRSMVNVNKKWRTDLSKTGQAKCVADNCEFSGTSFEEIADHDQICPLITKDGYICDVCRYYNISEDIVRKHILLKHSKVKCENDEIDIDSDGIFLECSEVDEASGIDETEISANETDSILSRSTESPKKHRKTTGESISKNLIDYDDDASYITYLADCRKHMRKFRSMNYSENSLFTYVLPNMTQTSTNLYEKSKSFNMKSMKFREKNDKNWSELEFFESKKLKDEILHFNGGPITLLAWVPLPVTAVANIQYLVVSSKDHLTKYNKVSNAKIRKSLLTVLEINTKTDKIKMIYSIYFSHGPINDICFLPSGGYDVPTNRLGVLAVASIKNCIEIFALPIKVTENCDLTSDKIRIIKMQPSIVLCCRLKEEQNSEEQDLNRTKDSGENALRDSKCLKITWSEFKGHTLVAGGFANNFVGIWDLDGAENLNLSIIDGVRHFVPMTFFRARKSFVKSLQFHYNNSGERWLLVADSRDCVCYDLQDVQSFVHQCGEDVSPNYPVLTTIWPSISESFYVARQIRLLPDLLSNSIFARNPNNLYRHRTFGTIPSILTDVEFLPWLGSFCFSTTTGDLYIQKKKHSIFDYDRDFSHMSRRYKSTTETVRFDKRPLVKISEIKNAKEWTSEFDESFLEYDGNYKETYGIVFDTEIKKVNNQKKIERYGFTVENFSKCSFLAANLNENSYNLIALGYANGFLRIKKLDNVEKLP